MNSRTGLANVSARAQNPDVESPEESHLLPMVAGVLETVVSANQQHQLASRQSELQVCAKASEN
jgi:hypothetical protein